LQEEKSKLVQFFWIFSKNRQALDPKTENRFWKICIKNGDRKMTSQKIYSKNGKIYQKSS
jgi:hypothetical protein